MKQRLMTPSQKGSDPLHGRIHVHVALHILHAQTIYITGYL
jgi:hypothetical protein